jgi:pimeloyl-ACP methyl ester carboxylesterase
LIKIALLKVGNGPIPLTVVNDIGQEPGTLYAARLAAQLPPELLQRFSLIGVDRRGSGLSDPISCVPDNVRRDLLGHDPDDPSADALLRAAGEAGQECAIELKSMRQALDSWRTAGDLDAIRDQLGVDKLNALGHGEGSNVLTAYSARYPDKVGRLVLDGIPDPSPDTTSVLSDIASESQSTVDALSADCASRGCSLGANATAAITEMVGKLRNSPYYLPDGTAFGPGLALRAVLSGLAQRARWPELTDAITATQKGNIAPLASFIDPLFPSGNRPPGLDVALATTCNDTTVRLPANQIAQTTADLQAKYPLFGGLSAQTLAWCGPWPVRREPLPALGAPGIPPVMVVNTAHDPITPGAGTTRAAQEIPGAFEVKWAGAGHGALNSPCVAGMVRGFLIDGQIPSEGTICPS